MLAILEYSNLEVGGFSGSWKVNWYDLCDWKNLRNVQAKAQLSEPKKDTHYRVEEPQVRTESQIVDSAITFDRTGKTNERKESPIFIYLRWAKVFTGIVFTPPEKT